MRFQDYIASQPRGIQTQLMRASGLSWSTIQKAARGERLSFEPAERLAEATGNAVTIDELRFPNGKPDA